MENNITVFLIDNNEIDNFIHQRVLENFSDHIRLFIFSNTSDALMYMNKNKIAPQFIFLSMNYPANDNFYFIKQLEELKLNKENTSICILSTLLLSSDIERIKIDYKFLNYIEKPLTVGKLHRVISLRHLEEEVQTRT